MPSSNTQRAAPSRSNAPTTTLAAIESSALLYALKQLDERERYVFLARVLDKRPFDVIGVQLGLSYKGAAAVYYRAIRKLKKSIEGVNGYDI